MLISTNTSTKPFSFTTLNLLKENLSILYADTDAKVRNEVLSNTKHMIERLRDSNAVLVRAVKPNTQNDTYNGGDTNVVSHDSDKALHAQQQFLDWYKSFLAGELVPTASYQRHITSLKAFLILLSAGAKSKHRTIDPSEMSVSSYFNPLFTRLLLDLLADPFEDVRTTATTILKLAPVTSFLHCAQSIKERTTGAIVGPQLLQDFLARVERASQKTGRADLADAVARANELLFTFNNRSAQIKYLDSMVSKLKKMVSLAETNFAAAVANVSIHEQFSGLR